MDMKVKTLGSLIDSAFELREKRRALAEQDKLLVEQFEAVQQEIMDRLDAEGTDKASSKKATVSISSNVVANVEDWDAFHAFIKKTGFFHLLQRRVSDAAYRELSMASANDKKLAKQLDAAGVVPFTKRTLNLRALKS